MAIKKGINYVYIGNLGFSPDTYCKKCNNKLISRSDGEIKITGLIGKNKNKCSNCKKILVGKII